MVSHADWTDTNISVQELGDGILSLGYGTEERIIFIADVVDGLTTDLDFITPNNEISNIRDYNFSLQKVTLAMVEQIVYE